MDSLGPVHQHQSRVHPSTYPKTSQGPFASDGAQYSNPINPSNMLVWPIVALNLPPAWVMTERPQLTKTGFKSSINP
jgi:hypothetical protein